MSVWGPMVSGRDVRAGAEAVLRRWLPSALAEVERNWGLAQGKLKPIQAWHRAASEEALRNADQLPALLIRTPDADLEVVEHETVNATYGLSVTVALRGAGMTVDGWTDVVDTCDAYTLAIRTVLAQHWADDSGLGGSCMPEGERHDPEGGERTLMWGTADFAVTVPQVLNPMVGPATPPVDPYEPSGDEPLVTDASVDADLL